MQICSHPQSSSEPTLSWYDLSPEVKRLLIAAAQAWDDPVQAQDSIQQALVLSNRSLDVLVAAYRYFFYQHNDAAALDMATQVMEQIQQVEQLPTDWDSLSPILLQRKEEDHIRLYLNAYAASGLLLARMGELDRAKNITARVSQIDNKREFGAETMWQILTQPDEETES